jgi:hypothetical protein
MISLPLVLVVLGLECLLVALWLTKPRVSVRVWNKRK